MNLSVVIPAHNEEEAVRPTIERLYGTLMEARIPFEILVVNDHSTDGTEQALQELAREMPGVRYVNNQKPGGFGRAIQTGLERFRGDAVCIVMADASDDPQDVVTYYRKLEEGYECVFGSRFMRGSRVVDYPSHKLLINRMANAFINTLFRLGFNDTTNAFKAYRREVIEGVKPLLSPHFNITVELPLKAITRGYTYAVVPINWYNRATGVSKLKIQEMGSRYLFIVLYVWLERLLSRGDYRRGSAGAISASDSVASSVNVSVDQLAELRATTPQRAVAVANASTASTASAPTLTREISAPLGSAAFSARPVALEATAQATRGETDSAPTTDVSTSQRTGALLPALTGILSAIPMALVAFILLMIWTHTPLVPYWDEWGNVVLVEHFTQGTLTWNDFWAFHNEHRIVIPQMIDLVLILATRWNRQIEMSFDLLLSMVEWGLLLASAMRGLKSKALLALAVAPMGLAIFSLTQYEDWLWAFQITFICTVLGVALCVWGLTLRHQGGRAFAITLIGAVLAALSSLGGLAVFVAFLPAVFALGYKKTLIWIALAIGIIVPYMQGFPHSVPIDLSLTTVKFCLSYLGAPVGSPSVVVSFFAGAVSVALAVANVLYYWLRERQIKPLLPWIGLGGFAIGLSLLTSFGRIALAPWSSIALTSRYQAFAVLWWVAVIYLLLLNCRGAWSQMVRGIANRQAISQISPWVMGANSLMLAIAFVGLVLANWNSVPNMETYQLPQRQSEACVVNADYAPTPCLWLYLPASPDVQSLSVYLRQERFGLFSGNYQQLEQPAPSPSAHALVRYFDPGTGDHWITTSYGLNFYGPYGSEEILGYIYDQQQPGTHALYTCVTADNHHFSSLSQTCTGGTYLRTEGWLLNKPVAPSQDVQLYNCADPVGGFVSPMASCEGQTPEGSLGYALVALP